MTAFRLGEKVLVRAILQRDGLKWVRREVEAFCATIAGKRTLWNSAWDSEGWEYPDTAYINHFANPFPAYLVAPDLRRIVRVSPEDLEAVP